MDIKEEGNVEQFNKRLANETPKEEPSSTGKEFKRNPSSQF